MDYLYEINAIINKLEVNDEDFIAKELISLKQAASTSSELLMSITYRLIQLINGNETIRILIGKEVNQLKDYCSSVGLHIEGNGIN